MSHFQIKCKKCGAFLEDTYCAFCEHCPGALLVSEYRERSFIVSDEKGIWRYNWLPVHKHNFPQPSPLVYRSEGLSDYLGLRYLYICFSGYWPEKGAELRTCTFKELEAAVVIQNARENGIDGLVVASAGNTARAMAYLSVVTGFPVVLVVPCTCLQDMWYLADAASVPTVAIIDGDYADSIDFARRLSRTMGYPFEGGVKNIAKRDGLGVVMLSVVEQIGRLPDHYFQAIGSGTGAIGVWEMADRLLRDGRFGNRLPRFHLSQNLPFAPMYKAWVKGLRHIPEDFLDPDLIPLITTRVLSNRYPAYSVVGGVYDLLNATGGILYGTENQDVYRAMELFEELEGIDIVPASGVALASLIKALREGNIRREDTVLLHITGGGEERLERDSVKVDVEPLFFSKDDSPEKVEESLCSLKWNS